MVNNLQFACFDVEMVVPFEFEGEFQSRVDQNVGGHEVPPCEE